MKKRVLSLLLVLCLAVSLAPTVFAQTSDFVLEADGAAITEMTESVLPVFEQDGWTTYTDVRLFTVTLPLGTKEVSFTSFADGSVLAYNYTPDGTYISGYYEDPMAGAATAQCPVDADQDGTPDYIAVQVPYDADFNTDLLYLVTFAFDVPFTMEANGAAVTEMTESVLPVFEQDGWTTYNDVRLITVTLPAGTDEVSFTSFTDGNVLTYNYTPDGTYISGYYEDPMTGITTAQCPVNADHDGAMDYIAVQVPYDADFNTALLYLVTFKYADFDDVTPEDWFYADVCKAVIMGLFDGKTLNTFAPRDPMTRAMFAATLYRLAGTPAAEGTHPFTDVAEDCYYSDAVTWAYSKGIIDGRTETTFDPDASVTRQEAAAMLYRYGGSAVGNASDLDAYTDKDQIADWALEAMCWAVQSGLMDGRTETTLVPLGIINRAEAAAMLLRLAAI